jgi:hypothetical protein
MAGGRFITAPILPAVKRRLMGVATQQPGVVTARDREFTTLRGAPKSSLLAPLSLSCSGIQISANIDEEIVNHQRCTICNAPRLAAAVSQVADRLGMAAMANVAV